MGQIDKSEQIIIAEVSNYAVYGRNLIAVRFPNMNKNKGSYMPHIIRIALCMLLIAAAIYRDRLFPVANSTFRFIVGIFFGLFSIIAIIRLILTFDALYDVYEYRKKTADTKQIRKTFSYSLEDMITAIAENDIIDIEAVLGTQSIHIGSSSDLDHGSNQYCDKRYYIGDDEYMTVSQFKNALLDLFPDRIIRVHSIDDLSPEDTDIVNLRKRGKNDGY